jgi:thioredoxin reductase (NADPH)
MQNNQLWDIVILGSGPAGFTAAIYTSRGAASTLLFAGEPWGGQLMLTTNVDNFPGFPQGILGPELMQAMRDQAARFGTKIIEKNVTSVDFSQTPFKLTVDKTDYLSRSVIIATGAQTRWLGVPGEKELIGRGVATCAPCDAPLFKEKKVIVIGGGDSAMEEALVLSKFAELVTIIHRRDQFRASQAMQQKVLNNPKINVLWNTQVTKFVGDSVLQKVILQNTQTNQTSELKTDGAFVAVGHLPSTELFKGQLELDEKGYLKKVPTGTFQMSTSVPGVFVAGEVHDAQYKQAITTAAFGCMAALEALKYLDKETPNW